MNWQRKSWDCNCLLVVMDECFLFLDGFGVGVSFCKGKNDRMSLLDLIGAGSKDIHIFHAIDGGYP